MVQIEGIVLGHADLLNFSSSFLFHTISQLHNLFEDLVDQNCIMGRNLGIYMAQAEYRREIFEKQQCRYVLKETLSVS